MSKEAPGYIKVKKYNNDLNKFYIDYNRVLKGKKVQIWKETENFWNGLIERLMLTWNERSHLVDASEIWHYRARKKMKFQKTFISWIAKKKQGNFTITQVSVLTFSRPNKKSNCK